MSTEARALLPTIALAAIGLVLGVVVAMGTRRVAWLEAHERDLPGEIVQLDDAGALTAGGARNLLSAELDRDDEVTFELCSGDAMDAAVWGGTSRVEIMLRGASGDERILETALDARALADARRSTHGACVVFGRGTLTTPGTYDVRLAWDTTPGFASVPLRARVLVRRSLSSSDGNLVFLVFCLSILFVLAAALRPSRAPTENDRAPQAVGRLALAVGLVMLTMAGCAFFMPGGRTWGLVAGLGLAVVEIAIAIVLARPARLDRLAWGRSDRALLMAFGVLAAPICGVLLRFAALESLASVPSTGEAPIEAYVSLPSGMLSFAIIAVIAPIAEEIFFRGFVYGTVHAPGSRIRAGLAFAAAWLIFGLVHLPQTWGNWGGLVAIVVAGLVLTALRAGFRSTLVPALAHLVYNGLLAAMALASAIAAGE